jgi:hypothetical protein
MLDMIWQRGIDIYGKNSRKIQYKYCYKFISESIFYFKYFFVCTRKNINLCILRCLKYIYIYLLQFYYLFFIIQVYIIFFILY